MIKVADIIKIIEYIAPPWMACNGDVNGLQAGGRSDSVERVLLALDATTQTIDYAVANKTDMLITHHPRFYRPLSNICNDNFLGSIAQQICQAGIAVYNAHTNLDVAPGGTNDALADIAGMLQREIIESVARDAVLKLTVYVDEQHVESLRQALIEAGAGEIGEYSEVSYQTIGLGRFRPGMWAKPFVGEPGQLTETEEWRLEMILPSSLKANIEKALVQAHPYEEPAYDFIRLEAEDIYGLGRVGILPRAIGLKTLARKFKKATSSKSVQILQSKAKEIRRLAVWSGSGVNIGRIIACGAECVVCGELGYHQAEELEFYGVSAIVLGHAPCEEIILPGLKLSLEAAFDELEIMVSPRFSPDFITVS